MLWYARDIGIFIVDRSNWYGVMITIWGFIDREIRFVLKVLKDHKNLADFIKRIEQIKYFIAFFIKDPTFNRTLYTSYRYKSYLSYPAYTKRSRNSQPFQRRDNKTYNIYFLSRVYKKDINSKNKNINRIN